MDKTKLGQSNDSSSQGFTSYTPSYIGRESDINDKNSQYDVSNQSYPPFQQNKLLFNKVNLKQISVGIENSNTGFSDNNNSNNNNISLFKQLPSNNNSENGNFSNTTLNSSRVNFIKPNNPSYPPTQQPILTNNNLLNASQSLPQPPRHIKLSELAGPISDRSQLEQSPNIVFSILDNLKLALKRLIRFIFALLRAIGCFLFLISSAIIAIAYLINI